MKMRKWLGGQRKFIAIIESDSLIIKKTYGDIKALCKSRGFTSREANSRNLLEGFFLSEIGIANAIGGLTMDEVVLLHLMKLTSATVDAAFFDRISSMALKIGTNGVLEPLIKRLIAD